MAARERARMGLINIIVFAARQSAESVDDTVGRRWGGGPALYSIQVPLTQKQTVRLPTRVNGPRRSACQRHKSSCHSPSFLRSFPFKSPFTGSNLPWFASPYHSSIHTIPFVSTWSTLLSFTTSTATELYHAKGLCGFTFPTLSKNLVRC